MKVVGPLVALFILSGCVTPYGATGGEVVYQQPESSPAPRTPPVPEYIVKDICAALRFSAENLKAGMEVATVRQRVGVDPLEFESTICGTSTPDPWRCLMWRYRIIRPGARAPYCVLVLYFAESEVGPAILNNWSFK